MTIITMIDPFILLIIMAALLASLITAPLGCIGLWNGLAFFGDTLAHASLLGVCFSVLSHVPYALGAVVVCLGIAYFIGHKSSKQNDVSLAVISYSCLSISILIISIFPKANLDPNTLLFGDLLSTDISDIYLLIIALCVLWGSISKHWPAILMTSFDADLAQVQGFPSKKVRLAIFFAYAITIGIVMKMLGALFAPALAIIPAAAARYRSKTPFEMISFATLISCISSLIGVWSSFYFDLPTGPSIICMATIILALIKISAR
ncbi:MAG: metal ABC transporter permease [Gammaproteobacteria bacterium]|nr:metal ABC transporter permease [Gammaproteobacteria bacterium]